MNRIPRGAFPEWEVNIEGKLYIGRFKSVLSAISSALNKYPDGRKYTDLVIAARKTQEPEVNILWDLFCSFWRSLGPLLERRIRNDAWNARVRLPP